LSRGHDYNNVFNEYPIDLVFEFFKVGNLNYRSQIKDIAIAVRAANLTKPEDFKAYLGETESLKEKSTISKPLKKEANKLKSLFRGFISGGSKRNR